MIKGVHEEKDNRIGLSYFVATLSFLLILYYYLSMLSTAILYLFSLLA